MLLKSADIRPLLLGNSMFPPTPVIRGNSFVRASNKRTRHTYSRGTYVPWSGWNDTSGKFSPLLELVVARCCSSTDSYAKNSFSTDKYQYGRSPRLARPLIEPIVGNGWFIVSREESSCHVILTFPPLLRFRCTLDRKSPSSILVVAPIIVNFRPFLSFLFFLFFPTNLRERWSNRGLFIFSFFIYLFV